MDIRNFYRKATAEEVRFYELELYSLQDKIFEIASVKTHEAIYSTGTVCLGKSVVGLPSWKSRNISLDKKENEL